MTVGANIKKFRRERDMTQDALAEFLGISSKSVSQWECGRTSPDISQLPMLANIFDVTVDELLGVNIHRKEQDIAVICEKADALSMQGQREDAIAVLRDGLKQYPNSYKIMAKLSSAVYCTYNPDLPEEDGKHILEEALELSVKVIEESTDIDSKSEAVQIASFCHSFLGDRKAAIELAMTVPEFDRNLLLYLLYSGSEDVSFKRETLVPEILWKLNLMDSLSIAVDDDGKRAYTTEEQLEIEKKIVGITELLFEEGDYFFAADRLMISYFRMASLYTAMDEHDRAVEYLGKGIDYGLQFDSYTDDDVHTSLLMRGVKAMQWYRRSPDDSCVKEMLEWLGSDEFDGIRDREDFAALICRLKEHCK